MRHQIVLIAAVGMMALAGPCVAQPTAVRMWTDGHGDVHRVSQPGVREGPRSSGPRAGVRWEYEADAAFAESVAISDHNNECWIGHGLNNARLTLLATNGVGVPIYEYAFLEGAVGIACADNRSLAVVSSRGAGGPTVLLAFEQASGPNPVWEYEFPAQYDDLWTTMLSAGGHPWVDVSEDGSVVVALGYDHEGEMSMLVRLDGFTGDVVESIEYPAVRWMAVDLSADGSRAVLSEQDDSLPGIGVCRVMDTASMTSLLTFEVLGTTGRHRISGDGKAAAAGGLDEFHAYREIGGIWQPVYSDGDPDHFFGAGMALSYDGLTLFAMSGDHEGQGFPLWLEHTYRVIDLDLGVELVRTTLSGGGNLQNQPWLADADDAGEVFVSSSWGWEDNSHPETIIWDRDLNIIGSIDSPGSPNDLSLTGAGDYLLVGTKPVHAGVFGNGAITYLYEFGTDCLADCDGNGTVDTLDFLCFLNKWVAGDPAADCDGNGTVDTLDFLCFLNEWVDPAC
jgi:hypothetical protein